MADELGLSAFRRCHGKTASIAGMLREQPMTERILIVEDNPVEAQEISSFLEAAGYELEIAEDAEKGFRRLSSGQMDLLLCDVHLPGKNGFDLCRQVRRHDTLKHLPIIIMTRFSDPLNVLRGLECGADGFLSKGQSPRMVVERVRRVLQRRHREAPGRAEPERVVFLQTEFHLSATRQQLLENLLTGFEDIVAVHELYERETRARSAAQKSLNDLTSVHETLWQSIPLSVAQKTLDGRYSSVNRHFCQFVGKSTGDILGKVAGDLFPTKVADRLERLHRRSVATNRSVESIETLQNRNGEEVRVQVREVPIHDARGGVTGILGVFWEVSDSTRSGEQLRPPLLALEKRDKEQTRHVQECAAPLAEKCTELEPSSAGLATMFVDL